MIYAKSPATLTGLCHGDKMLKYVQKYGRPSQNDNTYLPDQALLPIGAEPPPRIQVQTVTLRGWGVEVLLCAR